MHLGRVIGTVVATVKTPVFAGHRLLLVQPCDWSGRDSGRAFVAIDTVAAGRGEWVFYVKGREAANALADPFNPSDRTLLGIVDEVQRQQLDAGGATRRRP